MGAGWTHSVRYAGLALRRRPGTAVAGALVFGLGILIALAAWTVFRSVIIRDLPYPDADRLVRIRQINMMRSAAPADVAPGDLLFWLSRAKSFQAMAGMGSPNFQLLWERTDANGFEAQRYVVVTPDFFRVMGVPAAQGRVFDHPEARATFRIAVISDRLWRSRFGARSDIIGLAVRRLDGEVSRIIGVMPTGFDYPNGTNVWTPGYVDSRQSNDHTSRSLAIVAKLLPTSSLGQATREMNDLAAQIEERWPGVEKGWRPYLEPVFEDIVQGTHAGLTALWGAATLLLMVAVTNVATMLLVGVTRRQREFRVRAALGAGRHQIWLQLSCEGLIVAVTGGLAGVIGASWLIEGVHHWLPADFPRSSEISLGSQAAAATLVVAAAVGMLWGGLLTAWAWRETGTDRLVSGSPAVTSRTGFLTGAGVSIATAIAFTVVLTGNMSLMRLLETVSGPLGFDGSSISTVRVHMSGQTLERAASLLEQTRPKRGELPAIDGLLAPGLLVEELLASVGQLPGVRRAALVSHLVVADPPLMAAVRFVSPCSSEGDSVGVTSTVAAKYSVTPGYFDTLGIERRSGRVIGVADRLGTRRVAVVNQTLATRLWGTARPVAGCLIVEEEVDRMEVVGVVADTVVSKVGEAPVPQIYIPYGQSPDYSLRLLIQGRASAENLDPAVRREIERLGMVFVEARSMSSIVWDSLWMNWVTTALINVFAVAALGLCTAGLYGVVSRIVSARSQEIAVRVALGAHAVDIVRQVLGSTVAAVVAGLAGGTVVSLILLKAFLGSPGGEGGALSFGVIATVVLIILSCLLATLRPLAQALRPKSSWRLSVDN